MSAPDPMDVLRGLAAAERAALPEPPAADPIVRDVERTTTRRRRRRIVAIIASGSVLAAGGGVAWALTHRAHAPNPTVISCIESTQPDADQKVIDPDGTDPVELCRRAWTEISPDWGPPPPLVGCVSATGIAAVYPGDDTTCEALGLAPLETFYDESDREALGVRERLIAEMEARGCVSRDDAKQLIEEEFERSGLTDWNVAFLGVPTAQTPCSALAFDPAARTVAIAPLPDTFADDQGG